LTPEKQLPEPHLVVFGADASGSRAAAWFNTAEAGACHQGAGLMGMRLLTVETDEQRAIALQLPRGRVFASGRAFTLSCARPCSRAW
jgi:hypothetical protein